MVKTAHEVRQNLKRKGFECTDQRTVCKTHLTRSVLLALTKEYKLIVTLEENVEGGFGEHVSEFYEEIGSDVQVICRNDRKKNNCGSHGTLKAAAKKEHR